MENGSLRDALAILDEQIATRERELGELRAARRHLLALVPQETLLDEPQAPRAPMRQAGFFPPERVAKTIPPGTSIPDAAEIVVRDTGNPLPADAIARAMLARGHKYEGTFNTLVDTVRGVLGREVRRGRMFTRFGRGKFGLLEWGDAPEVVEDVEEDAQESETA